MNLCDDYLSLYLSTLVCVFLDIRICGVSIRKEVFNKKNCTHKLLSRGVLFHLFFEICPR